MSDVSFPLLRKKCVGGVVVVSRVRVCVCVAVPQVSGEHALADSRCRPPVVYTSSGAQPASYASARRPDADGPLPASASLSLCWRESGSES